MNIRYAYNTSGAANHRLDDTLALIVESGYAGVALILDPHHFDPFAPDLAQMRWRATCAASAQASTWKPAPTSYSTPAPSTNRRSSCLGRKAAPAA